MRAKPLIRRELTASLLSLLQRSKVEVGVLHRGRLDHPNSSLTSETRNLGSLHFLFQLDSDSVAGVKEHWKNSFLWNGRSY